MGSNRQRDVAMKQVASTRMKRILVEATSRAGVRYLKHVHPLKGSGKPQSAFFGNKFVNGAQYTIVPWPKTLE